MSAGAALAIQGLEVRYGPVRALGGVNIDVLAGELLAVLGPNGAGKSTLARTIAGLLPVTAGRILLDGVDIVGRAPHRVRRAGVAYIPEGRGIFPGLSVIDNLRMAVRQVGGREARSGDRARRRAVPGARRAQPSARREPVRR